jgi:hypothetical protein
MYSVANKTLGYTSDIHLERNVDIDPVINSTTDYLAICGDIGDPFDRRYEDFIRRASDNFERIFFTAGNHEFDNMHNKKGVMSKRDVFNKTLDRLYDIADGIANVEFLHRDISMIDDYNVLGAILWTERMDVVKSEKSNATYKYNVAYNNIINVEHKKDVNFIDSTLKNLALGKENKKTIVLTHHIPSFKMCPKRFMDFKSKSHFYNNLDHLFDHNIHAWLCGHSHHIGAQFINGSYCGINSFDTHKIVPIELKKIHL